MLYSPPKQILLSSFATNNKNNIKKDYQASSVNQSAERVSTLLTFWCRLQESFIASWQPEDAPHHHRFHPPAYPLCFDREECTLRSISRRCSGGSNRRILRGCANIVIYERNHFPSCILEGGKWVLVDAFVCASRMGHDSRRNTVMPFCIEPLIW